MTRHADLPTSVPCLFCRSTPPVTPMRIPRHRTRREMALWKWQLPLSCCLGRWVSVQSAWAPDDPDRAAATGCQLGCCCASQSAVDNFQRYFCSNDFMCAMGTMSAEDLGQWGRRHSRRLKPLGQLTPVEWHIMAATSCGKETAQSLWGCRTAGGLCSWPAGSLCDYGGGPRAAAYDGVCV